jgi:C_GCAxxG_C_C family probable redox protein
MKPQTSAIRKKQATALRLFAQEFNCAQAVLSACGAKRGIDRKTALGVAGGFGGGMGGTGGTCGAVTGAVMAIGLAHAMTHAHDPAAKRRCNELVREFFKRYKARRGGLLCRELLGCDISIPEGIKKARDAGLFKTVCRPLVADAVDIVEKLLAEAKSRR